MSTRISDLLMGRLGELRHEPTQKRIRARLGDRTVIGSARAARAGAQADRPDVCGARRLV
jgi:hypothetical protein